MIPGWIYLTMVRTGMTNRTNERKYGVITEEDESYTENCSKDELDSPGFRENRDGLGEVLR
jgi:hypothetical protein